MTTPTDLPARVEEALALCASVEGEAFTIDATPECGRALVKAQFVFPALAADWKRLREERETYIDKVRGLEDARVITKNSRNYNAGEVERLRERDARMTAEMERTVMVLPIIQGSTALAWDGSNLYPHVVAVADEFAIRSEQVAAYSREVAALRERERVLTEALEKVWALCDADGSFRLRDCSATYALGLVNEILAPLFLAPETPSHD